MSGGIEFSTGSHSNFSMTRTGTMPPGTTKERVLEVIGDGTFGGRWDWFEEGIDGQPGSFRYI
ncbi:hypothetical protein, partial [Ruegeria sp. HKCCD8929]|uniref:hypothetical protein n=1 Tax=Ruegeria sp. HKCCD8929 TaxID=2683006 RepID=UPI001C2CB235